MLPELAHTPALLAEIVKTACLTILHMHVCHVDVALLVTRAPHAMAVRLGTAPRTSLLALLVYRMVVAAGHTALRKGRHR